MVKHVRTSQGDQVLTLAQRRAFMTLSLEERRKMLAAQAERMVTYYEQESERSEREAWQGAILARPDDSIPRLGEIWLVNFDPTIGTEIRKTRPAVVVSSDAVGRLPIKLVAPVTDWKEHFTPNIWHVRIDPIPPTVSPKCQRSMHCNCAVWIIAALFGSWGKFHSRRWRKLFWLLRRSSNIHNAARCLDFDRRWFGNARSLPRVYEAIGFPLAGKFMKQNSLARFLSFHSDNRKPAPSIELRADFL